MAVVLVIDDDPVVRLLATTALARSGLEVWEASDRSEALARLRNGMAADAIVLGLDAAGPEDDLLGELRAEEPAADPPVVVLSGRAGGDDFSRAFAQGAADYVTKPFDPDQLARAVRAVVFRNADLAG